MRTTRIVCMLSMALAAPAAARATTILFVATGQTGSQVSLDANHSLFWAVAPATSGFEFGGGSFVLKRGPATAADTTLSLWQGAPVTGLLLAQYTLGAAAFDAAHPGNDQVFDLVPYRFSTPAPLAAGQQYTVALTSSAADAASRQYFIKGPEYMGFVDENGTRLAPGVEPAVEYGQTAGVRTPEPESWLLMAGGAALLLFARAGRHLR